MKGVHPMRTNLFMSAAIAALALASPAVADDGADLVITATRQPTEAIHLPTRIDTISRADIETNGIVSLTEAIGADAVQAGGAGQQASVFLRGANSKHVLSLFDGIRLNDASTPNAQYDFGLDTLGALDRVEVLRGPASTIYGSDAIGGVVNMIPRRGGASVFAPFLEASGGSFGTGRGLIGASGTDDGLAYGLSAEMFTTDGYDLVPGRMLTHTGERDGARVNTFTASARRDFGDFAIDAVYRYRDSATAYDTFSGGPFFDLRADDPDMEGEATQTVWRVGGEADAGTALTFRLSGGQVLADRSESDAGFTISDAHSTRDFADLAALYRSDGVSLTAGLSFEQNDIDTRPQFASPLSVSEDQSAAYLIGQFDLGQHLVATGSVRIDDYEAFGTHTTYALGAVATYGDLRVFGSYGTAFKAPSLSERYEVGFFNTGNPDLEPETSESWEIGADWSLHAMWRLGASYYQTRIDNLIEYDFGALQNINVGEARIDGAEVYIAFAPTGWADFKLEYDWTDATNGDTGAQLARRPKDALSLHARLHPSARATLALTWTYVGDRTDVTYDDLGQFLSSAGRVDAYNLGAIAASYDLDAHAALFIRVNNVTDETYEQPAAFAGAPRNVLFGLRAKF